MLDQTDIPALMEDMGTKEAEPIRQAKKQRMAGGVALVVLPAM